VYDAAAIACDSRQTKSTVGGLQSEVIPHLGLHTPLRDLCTSIIVEIVQCYSFLIVPQKSLKNWSDTGSRQSEPQHQNS